MKFSFDWIRELSGYAGTALEAAELLSSKAFEVESVIDGVMEIKVLPNRPDCVSHLGIARELCALSATRFSAPVYEWRVSEQPAREITITDSRACPRYSALVVRGLKVGPSPRWLVERLAQCGQQSINNVVDATNYAMLELGQPLHAFDLSLVDRIIVRHAEPGETVIALDQAHTTYPLDESMLVIADSTHAMAIAGIKGGVGTGISSETTDVLLEAANFSPESIRATSRKLNLRTDASIRFGYGVDPNLTSPALMRTAQLLAKVAGGAADGGILDVYPEPVVQQTVMLDAPYADALLGVHIEESQMKGILTSLGFEVTDRDGRLAVHVPTRRSDVAGPEDIIEEIGRVYGYDAIPSAAPVIPVYDEKSWVHEDEDTVWDEFAFIRERGAIGRLLVGAGYTEVYNYAFISDELKAAFGLEQLRELVSPQSAEYRYLRPGLLNRLVLSARDNLRFAETVRLFETGRRFPVEKTETSRLCFVLASKKGDDELFYEMKGVVDLLHERFGVTDTSYHDSAPFTFTTLMQWCAPGRGAEIRISDGPAVGVVGLLNPSIASQLKMKHAVAFAELDLKLIISHAQHEREFEPLPKYPSIVRDIAVLVPADTKIDDILQIIQSADTQGLVRDIDVFDIFLPTGKEKLDEDGPAPRDPAKRDKSVAFHVVLRADDRTLTDKEAEEAENIIKRALEVRLDAQIR